MLALFATPVSFRSWRAELGLPLVRWSSRSWDGGSSSPSERRWRWPWRLAAASGPTATRARGLIPPADAPANPTEPASAPGVATPTQGEAVDANGTEPFWAVKIRRDTIVLSRPDHPDVMAVNSGPFADGDRTVWRSTSAATGESLTVALTPGDCANGMSDRHFPLKAQVVLGSSTLNGCAEAAVASTPAPRAAPAEPAQGLPAATE